MCRVERAVDERVVRRDPVAACVIVRHVHVDPQELAEQGAGRLCKMHRVARASTVAHAHVQIAIRAEHQVPAVVIRERLRDERATVRPDQVLAGREVGAERIVLRAVDARDNGIARKVREVDEHASRSLAVHGVPHRRAGRLNGEPEESALAATRDLIGEVEKRVGPKHAVHEHADSSALLDDEDGGRVTWIGVHADWVLQAGDDHFGSDLPGIHGRSAHPEHRDGSDERSRHVHRSIMRRRWRGRKPVAAREPLSQ